MTPQAAMYRKMFETIDIGHIAKEINEECKSYGTKFIPKKKRKRMRNRFIRDCRLALQAVHDCIDIADEFDDEWHPAEGLVDIHFAIRDVRITSSTLSQINLGVLQAVCELCGPDIVSTMPHGLTERILTAAPLETRVMRS